MNNEIETVSDWFVTLIKRLGPFFFYFCNISRIIQKPKDFNGRMKRGQERMLICMELLALAALRTRKLREFTDLN